jgi:hypothetical protein
MGTKCTAALDQIYDTSTKSHTPIEIVQSTKFGISSWISPGATRVRAPTSGHLGAAPTILAMAFYEQQHSLGWFHFFLGRISLKWCQTSLYSKNRTSDLVPQQWASNLIASLWTVPKTMWAAHYDILPGSTAEKAAQ